MRRQAAVPIDADPQAEIRAQQQRVADPWPKAHPHLFPGTIGNPNGQRPLSYCSYRTMLQVRRVFVRYDTARLATGAVDLGWSSVCGP